MSFDTKRGLSTHERIKHPAVRNEKRQNEQKPKAVSEPSSNARGKHKKVWTDEEIETLKKLDIKYYNYKQPNVHIKKYITTKTIKQISDKRRELRLQNEATAASNSGNHSPDIDTAPSDGITHTPRPSSGTLEEVFVETNEGPNRTENDTDHEEWLRTLQNAINKIKNENIPAEIKNIYKKLIDIWESSHIEPIEMGYKINVYIADTLIPYLLLENNTDETNNRNTA